MSEPESALPRSGRAPDSLLLDGNLVFGTWDGVPGSADLLGARRPYSLPLPRFVRRLRLKEWQAIQAGDEDWFLCAVLYDAKFVSMAQIDLWDRKEKKKYGFRHMFPGSRFSLPESLATSETQAKASGDYLSIRVDARASFVSLKVYSPPRRSKLDIELRFDLSGKSTAPFSVCLPLGLNRAIYSTKVLMPCSGSLAVAGKNHRFEPSSASGVLDDHKGYYPYRLHYDWVTGFGIDPSGRRVGFNLTDNQVRDQARYNENRLWIDGALHRLPPVKITRPYGRESPWIIQDMEGMVDLVFHPEVSHDIQLKLGIAEIDYAGPFGRFEGAVRSPAGETIVASFMYGMGEEKNVRM